jgi:hypothetical protein
MSKSFIYISGRWNHKYLEVDKDANRNIYREIILAGDANADNNHRTLLTCIWKCAEYSQRQNITIYTCLEFRGTLTFFPSC